MPLQLGDRNESVRLWRHVMNLRFGGLYTRLIGPMPDDTDLFGPRAQAWQKEYQSRTNHVQDGIVSDHDLTALGVPVPIPPPRHTVFSVNGFLGDMWTGYPAIVAQAMDPARCVWQPIGWTNNSIPMTADILGGIAELKNQINLHPGTFMFSVYSEGSIVGSMVADEILNGDMQDRKDDFIGAVAFGHPRRKEGSRPPGCPDPKGHGIARDRFENTPDFWWDYSDPGDMYTCTPDGVEGDDITSCYQMIAQSNIIGGSDTLEKQILQLLLNPTDNVIPLAGAIFKAITFFGGGVASHVHYHDREILPGVTYLNHAIGHLLERANAVTPR